MTLLWGTRQTSAHKGPREQIKMRLLIGQQGGCSGEVWTGNKAWVRNGRNSSPLSVERRFGAAGPTAVLRRPWAMACFCSSGAFQDDLPSGPLERTRVQWFSVVSSGRLGLLPPDCGPWAMIACAFDGAVARALQHGAGSDPVRVWVSQAAGSFRP